MLLTAILLPLIVEIKSAVRVVSVWVPIVRIPIEWIRPGLVPPEVRVAKPMKPEVMMPEAMVAKPMRLAVMLPEIVMPEAVMVEAAAKTVVLETQITRPDAYTNTALRLNGLRQRGHSEDKSGSQARQ